MNSNNNNNKKTAIPRKLHNPKAYAPASYLPCWLIQVPDAKLSLGAKMVYGRLSQWSNAKGIVHRSTLQLCNELGMSKSPIDRYLCELRKVELIGTYRIVKGGVNHFEFYDHEWMYEPIHSDLCYTDPIPDQVFDPTPKQTIPHTSIDVTPTPDQTKLKYNKIKINKDTKAFSPKIATSGISKDAGDKKSKSLTTEDLLADNPHSLEKEIIEEWLDKRKKKKNDVSIRAWKRLNKKLTLIHTETGILPGEAFETMVDANWLSLELHYFQKEPKGKKVSSDFPIYS